jgi:single-strand DNA-binding protein
MERNAMNKIFLIGRLGKDPEQRNLQNGGTLVSFSLATSESIKKDGQWQEKTQWHTVKTFDTRLCDKIMRSAQKGTLVSVVGKMNYVTTENKNTGHKQYFAEVELPKFNGEFLVLGDKKKQTGERDLEDEIPF